MLLRSKINLIFQKDANVIELEKKSFEWWAELAMIYIFLAQVVPELQAVKCEIMETKKCPLRRHILAPPEGLRALELPRVNAKNTGASAKETPRGFL